MKVIVLGAGVIGVTSAYYLAKAGHDVTVIDRQPGPALETSYANAGEVSPGYASPWAAPGIPRKAIKWLMMKHPPLIIKPTTDPRMALWLLRMLGNCNAQSYATNKARMVRVAEYSRDVMRQLRADTGIAYEERMQGTLQLFSTHKQVDNAAKDTAALDDYGVPYEVLTPAGCMKAEPGLARASTQIAGGLRLPGDETGDCHKFTQRLAEMAAELGVTFRFGVTVKAIDAAGGAIARVSTSAGECQSDAYVLAAGSFGPGLASMVGLDLPIYPVKGYSITATIVDETIAPVSTVLDETYKVAVTRLGNRIRVGGMAEISGYNLKLSTKRRDTLVHCVENLFPGAGDTASASFWTGMRPMTPDSTPIIGPTKLSNCFINGGHGTLGWTMACGSARLIADIVSGKSTDIDSSDLSIFRYTAS